MSFHFHLVSSAWSFLVRGPWFFDFESSIPEASKGLISRTGGAIEGVGTLIFPLIGAFRSSLGGPVELCQGEWVRNPRCECGEFQFGKCMHGSSQEGRWTSDGDLFSWWWSVTWFSTWCCFFGPPEIWGMESWKLKMTKHVWKEIHVPNYHVGYLCSILGL